MRRTLLALVLASTAIPALAQHAGHGTATIQDPHAGHDMGAAQASHAGHDTGVAQDPHAGHDTGAAQDPHAGHDTGAAQHPHAGHDAGAAQDPHAGHDMGADPDTHAGHDMASPARAPAPPVGPPPPEALTGPDDAADHVYGSETMREAREQLRREHGGLTTWGLFADQLEVSFRDGDEGFAWEDVQFRYGTDIDRLWIKTAGEGTFGEGIEQVEVQALWSHALDPWFDLQAGLRYDFEPDPERAYLVLGVQGLAPYWFEVDSSLFLSEKGDLSARLEAEYDQRITQRLILQPRVEASLALQDVPELGTGSGLSSAEAGIRLRYEFVPEFAPYVGVEYERAFGDTAGFRRLAGQEAGGWGFVAGVRLWF